jgi:hypothetical protein
MEGGEGTLIFWVKIGKKENSHQSGSNSTIRGGWLNKETEHSLSKLKKNMYYITLPFTFVSNFLSLAPPPLH